MNLITDTLFKGDCQTEFKTLEKNNRVSQLTLRVKNEKDEIQLSFSKFYSPNQKLEDKEMAVELSSPVFILQLSILLMLQMFQRILSNYKCKHINN